LKAKIRQCDVCVHAANPLPVTPNPILSGNTNSKIRIIGQAPGTLAHASGRPFTDPSGVRLRDWLGVTENEFYNEDYFAITPMGFCFPGHVFRGKTIKAETCRRARNAPRSGMGRLPRRYLTLN